MNRPIEVVIDSLVLDGFDPASRDAIAAATIAALGDLLRSRAPTLQTADTSQVVAQPIRLASLTSPRAIGEGIAQAVHAALPAAWPRGAGG